MYDRKFSLVPRALVLGLTLVGAGLAGGIHVAGGQALTQGEAMGVLDLFMQKYCRTLAVSTYARGGWKASGGATADKAAAAGAGILGGTFELQTNSGAAWLALGKSGYAQIQRGDGDKAQALNVLKRYGGVGSMAAPTSGPWPTSADVAADLFAQIFGYAPLKGQKMKGKTNDLGRAYYTVVEENVGGIHITRACQVFQPKGSNVVYVSIIAGSGWAEDLVQPL